MRLVGRVALRRVRFLAQAEVIHVVRDRATLTQIIVMPLVQLLLLSNAATFAIRDTPALVVDFDRTSTSRGLVSRLGATGDFRIIDGSASPDAANDALLHGQVTLVLTIPRDFEASLVRNGTAPVQLELDGEKGSAAGIVQEYAGEIIGDYSAELTAALHPTPLTVQAGAADPIPTAATGRIETRVRSWYNPTLDYKQYMVPGILVALVTMIGTLLTAQNIAREKEAGTLEQLNVTPITKGQFIAAKLLPFWVLALIDLALGLALGHFAFGVPIRGSLLLLFASAGVYLMAALGVGLLISTIVETQQQAMFVTFFIIMIYLLLSGLFTPIDSMPSWAQVFAQLNPVSHFVTISRAILVKGAGLAEVSRPLLILVVYGAAVFVLAVRQYSKRTA